MTLLAGTIQAEPGTKHSQTPQQQASTCSIHACTVAPSHAQQVGTAQHARRSQTPDSNTPDWHTHTQLSLLCTHDHASDGHAPSATLEARASHTRTSSRNTRPEHGKDRPREIRTRRHDCLAPVISAPVLHCTRYGCVPHACNTRLMLARQGHGVLTARLCHSSSALAACNDSWRLLQQTLQLETPHDALRQPGQVMRPGNGT